jgi:hypothetical protein
VSSTVDHPPHYNRHPSGVECVEIAEGFGFNLGNAIKYIWRAGLKDGTDVAEDLAKARWYLDREIARFSMEGETHDLPPVGGTSSPPLTIRSAGPPSPTGDTQ